MNTTPAFDLTPYEIRIIQLIGEGKTSREIAVELKKSPRTIENQLSDIYLKLNVSKAAQAVLVCKRAQLIQ